MYPINKKRIHRKTTLVKGFVILLSKNTIFQRNFYIRCVEQKERPRSSLSAFFSCTYLTANSNTPDADMADSIRGVLRRSRINRVMKIEVNDKKSVGSVKANMVVRINVIVSSF